MALAFAGIMSVGLANAHIHHLPAAIASLLPSIWTQTIERVLHTIQDCGGSSTVIPWHRIINVSGCGMLLTSNYLSQQQGCAYHDHSDGDGHDHHHHHHGDHDHGSGKDSCCS